ncbi:hypothetical protein KEP85_03825, partial [Escherichia coli]|nr:hypothetical protein [Escherichia coli]
AFSSGAGRTSDGNGSHASTLKSPSYTKSVSWQHYRTADRNRSHWSTSKTPSYTKSVSWQHHLQKLHNKVNITANVRFDIVIFQPDTTRKRKEKGVI